MLHFSRFRISILTIFLLPFNSYQFCHAESAEADVIYYHHPANMTKVYRPHLINDHELAVSPTGLDLGLMVSNNTLISATCTGHPFAYCLGSAIEAIILTYFKTWYGLVTLAKRSVENEGAQANIHPQWEATTSCSTDCMLLSGAPANEWTLLGNATVHNVRHDLHFYHDGIAGGVRGLTAARSSKSLKTSSESPRQMVDDIGGATAAFYFENVSQNGWADLASSDNVDDAAAWFADSILEYSEACDAQIVCANMFDADGSVNYGVWTFSWDDAMLPDTVASAENQIHACKLDG